MTSLLQQLEASIQQEEDRWQEAWLQSHGQPRSGKAYHYTDAAGLIGILSEGVFRGTNIFYLNDRSEINHCAELIKRRLDIALQSLSGPIAQVLVHAKERFNPFETLTIYVACFSENPDQLSQWRGYGGGGRGYSIGIAPRQIVPTGENPRILTRKVIYQHDKQVRLVDDAISALRAIAEPVFANNHPPEYQNIMSNLVNFFRRRVADYLWCFKNSAFEEEQEWRFGYLAGPLGTAVGGDSQREVKFRVGAGGIVPYVDLDIFNVRNEKKESLAVCEVVCGPTFHPNEEITSVRTLLHQRHYVGVEVLQSGVPLRR